MQKQRPGPRPLGDLIQDFWRDQGLSNSGRQERIFRAWTAAVGPEAGRGVEPVRFRSGELTIEVPSTVHLHEFKNYRGEGYRRQANEKLGSEVIRRVVFKLGTR